MSPVFELCEHCHIFRARKDAAKAHAAELAKQLEAKKRRVAELEKELAEERALHISDVMNTIAQTVGLQKRVEALERKNATCR